MVKTKRHKRDEKRNYRPHERKQLENMDDKVLEYDNKEEWDYWEFDSNYEDYCRYEYDQYYYYKQYKEGNLMTTILANKSRNFGAIKKYLIEKESRNVLAYDMVFNNMDWLEIQSMIGVEIFKTASFNELVGEVKEFAWKLGVYDDFYYDTVIISTNLPFDNETLQKLRDLGNKINVHKPNIKILLAMVSEIDYGLMTINKAITTLEGLVKDNG